MTVGPLGPRGHHLLPGQSPVTAVGAYCVGGLQYFVIVFETTNESVFAPLHLNSQLKTEKCIILMTEKVTGSLSGPLDTCGVLSFYFYFFH